MTVIAPRLGALLLKQGRRCGGSEPRRAIAKRHG
jgi:hypothetical protein